MSARCKLGLRRLRALDLQWEGGCWSSGKANRLLAVPKVYTLTTMIDIAPGTDYDYQLESDDGSETFIFDVRVPRRNVSKARFQLRYQRSIVLARLCHSAPHTNPDGEFVKSSHFHTYRERFDDKWTESLKSVYSIIDSLEVFCRKVNLPVPSVQGGP
ncbi:MAG: DUF6978 family protein [Pseudonocardiaceae bacterium]